MTIKEEVRMKVITMHGEGIGRNRIAFQTGVSAASVTNILREIKNKDTTAIDSSQTQIDFSDTSYPESYPNIGPIVNVQSINVESKNATAEKAEERGIKHLQPRSTLSNVADTSIIDLGMDWDDPAIWERRLFKEIVKEKRKRHEEFQRIEQERAQINQQIYDLKIREARLADYESLIPSARELRNNNISVELLFPYISLINEKAALENTDVRTAAINLARELEDYKQTMSDLKAEGIGIQDLAKLAERKLDDDYASNLIWGGNY
jgi:hypothetical protein